MDSDAITGLNMNGRKTVVRVTRTSDGPLLARMRDTDCSHASSHPEAVVHYYYYGHWLLIVILVANSKPHKNTPRSLCAR